MPRVAYRVHWEARAWTILESCLNTRGYRILPLDGTFDHILRGKSVLSQGSVFSENLFLVQVVLDLDQNQAIVHLDPLKSTRAKVNFAKAIGR